MSKDDALKKMLNRLEHIKCGVRDCVNGYATGVYAFGPRGTGKTEVIERTLNEMKAKYDGDIKGLTDQGLLELAEENDGEHRNRHILLDDCYEGLKKDRFRQYLLGLLRHVKDKDDPDKVGVRTIKYKRHRQLVTVKFEKSIMITSNVPLISHDSQILEAVEDRVNVYDHDPPPDEMIAFIYHLAETEDYALTPKERLTVADFVVEKFDELSIKPSLRWYCDKGIKVYKSDKLGKSSLGWKERLAALMEKKTLPQVETQDAHRSKMLAIAAKCWHEGTNRKEREALWIKATGKTARTAYRYWGMLGLTEQ